MQRWPAAPKPAPASALAVLAAEVVHVRAHVGRSDKRNRLDIRVRADRVDHILAAMNHVQHARRNARFERKFDQFHGGQRVLFGRLQHEGIAAHDRHREHPERDHRGKIKRRDAGANTDRLTQRVGVHTTCHVLRKFALLQCPNRARMFDHFEAAEDIAFSIG
jgi:hypothetical protein